jgi:biotin-(acetyl-CoA carboxylase) ligase
MECSYQIVCPFFRRKIAIHDAMYQQHVRQYCSSAGEECAIQQVMKGASFLKVPNDLYPNQKWRVAGILATEGPLAGVKRP